MEGDGEFNMQTILSVEPTIVYQQLTFNTGSATPGNYRTFVENLRANLSSGDTVTSYRIPLLLKPSDITKNNKYFLVELVHFDNSITVAISVVNLYVIAYKTGNLSFFFKEAPPDAESLLFGETERKRLDVSTNYNSFKYRDEVPLGIQQLKAAIDTLHFFNGKDFLDEQKKTLLVVIEMVAEATRYNFVLEYIEKGFHDGYTPKGDTVSYENKWDFISEQIQLSNDNGEFPKTVEVKDKDYNKKDLNYVSDVAQDIAILKYHGRTRQNPENSDFN